MKTQMFAAYLFENNQKIEKFKFIESILLFVRVMVFFQKHSDSVSYLF